jgi:hypothetical protein
VFRVLASVSYTSSVGNILRLEGTTLRFFVNNILRASETDASYASGRHGLTIFIGAGAPSAKCNGMILARAISKLDVCDICRHMAVRLESNSFEWNVLRMFAVHGLDWGRMVYVHT